MHVPQFIQHFWLFNFQIGFNFNDKNVILTS